MQDYTNVVRWTEEIAAREPVRRGTMVNRTSGDPSLQLHERHDASDFELRTQDKIAQDQAPEDEAVRHAAETGGPSRS